MAFVKGRGIKVEIAKTLGTGIAVSALTQASPGVATATAHGQADAVVGFFANVSGMVQLEGQAVRVDAPTANNFTLQGLNTTAYSAYNSGTFTPVSAWSTLAECDQYDIGGGAADKVDTTCLIDVVKQEENGLLPTQSVTLNIKATDTPTEAMGLIESAAQAGTSLVFRITLQNGAVRVFRGEPSLPGESVQAGAVGTGSLSVNVKGYVLKLAA